MRAVAAPVTINIAHETPHHQAIASELVLKPEPKTEPAIKLEADVRIAPGTGRDDQAPLITASLPPVTEAPQTPLPPSRKWLKPQRPGLVKSIHGATALVAPRHQTKFQCLVDWLDQNGFRIGAMLGYGQRPFGGSLHPIGAAIDIDQARRNHLIRGKRYPDGVNDAAARCGLMHGDRTAWPRHPDYGHFQVIGVSRGNWRARRDAVARASQTPAPTTSGSSLDVR